MRVLYVIDSLAPSGAERSLASMAPGLRGRGIELDIVYLRERKGLRDQLQRAGCRTFSLRDPMSRRAGLRRLRSLIREVKPHLVHTTLFESDVIGRPAARLSGVPVVSSLVNVHYGPDQLNDPRLNPTRVRAARLADAATARLCARFHAITDHVAEVMGRRLWIGGDRIEVIPRGRDPVALGVRTPQRRAAARASLGIPEGSSLVLAVARHEHQKGLDVALTAWRSVTDRVPGAVLAVAGREGAATRDLRRTVDELRLNGHVAFLGARQDVAELLCAADALVLPSRWEGFGGTLLEAMALQAAIVASDLPPVREVVGEAGAAVLVPPEDPSSLAGALIDVLRDRDAATARARRAHDRFLERFTIDAVDDAMVRFYGRALAAA